MFNMDIRNCSRCKKIYKYDGFRICHSCRQDDEKDFQRIKEYLDENPGGNISDVVDATGIDSKKVIEFLREGRLELEGGGALVLDCERCGAPITTGRYCKKCTAELQKEIGGALDSSRLREERKRESKGQFRYIGRGDKNR